MVSPYFADILGLGTPELIIIVVIILLIFGGSQLPKLARNLGSSAKELRKGLDDAKSNKPQSNNVQNTSDTSRTDQNQNQ